MRLWKGLIVAATVEAVPAEDTDECWFEAPPRQECVGENLGSAEEDFIGFDGNTSTVEECFELCQDTDNCRYFVHNENVCLLYKLCIVLDPDNLIRSNKVVCGERPPIATRSGCRFETINEGHCLATTLDEAYNTSTFIQKSLPRTLDECFGDCQKTAGCQFFINFGNYCFLSQECKWNPEAASDGDMVQKMTCDSDGDSVDVDSDNADSDDSSESANVVVGGEGTPCPSDCWNWNSSAKKCEINEDAGCFSLVCKHDSILVNFASKLFGISDQDQSDVLDGPEANFDSNDSIWNINCKLGECDMTVETEEIDGKNNLVFSFDVGKPMEKVVMSGKDVFIDPVSASLTFKCRYLAEVDLTSTQFTVKGATATGESVNIGTLDDGFGLVLYTDTTYETVTNNENVFVGYPIYGKVDWSVTTAQTAVNFYISQCNVESDAAKIAIINDTCYSTTLGARQLQENKLVAASSAFTFTAFTIGDFEMETTVACTVRLCLVSDSDCAKDLLNDDADCPDDEAYGYKAVTFQ